MRINLDDEACQGHGRCYSLAPKLFDCDDAGYAILRVAEVDPALEEDARVAADNCPEMAITLE